MKMRNFMLVTLGFSFLLGVAHGAKKKRPPPAPAEWPVVLLNHPFHVGDDKTKMFEHPKPDGGTFKAKFRLPETIAPGRSSFIYINITERGISSSSSAKPIDQPNWYNSTKLLVNGSPVAVLNKLVSAPKGGIETQMKKGLIKGPGKQETLRVRVNGTHLNTGLNEIEINSAVSAKERDDFELYRVTASSEPQ